jgi:hypothetical protein
MIDSDSRDQMIGTARQEREANRFEDVKIAQKVMAAHRAAFKEKFPGQCEHIMRLIAERLQLGLRKDNAVEMTAGEICDLARALNAIYDIHVDIQVD